MLAAVEEATSLLRAIYVFHSSHGQGSHLLSTLAASPLESISMEAGGTHECALPCFDAFTVALQTNLLGAAPSQDRTPVLASKFGCCRRHSWNLIPFL